MAEYIRIEFEPMAHLRAYHSRRVEIANRLNLMSHEDHASLIQFVGAKAKSVWKNARPVRVGAWKREREICLRWNLIPYEAHLAWRHRQPASTTARAAIRRAAVLKAEAFAAEMAASR